MLTVLPFILGTDDFKGLPVGQQEEMVRWLSQDCHVAEPPDVWCEVCIWPNADNTDLYVSSWVRREPGSGIAVSDSGTPVDQTFDYRVSTTPPSGLLAGLSRTWRWCIPCITTSTPFSPREATFTMEPIQVVADHEPIVVEAKFLDRDGEPVPPSAVYQIPHWSSSDETVAYVSSTTADGMKATVAFCRMGTATLVARAVDADDHALLVVGRIVVDGVSGPVGTVEVDEVASVG